MSEGPVNAVTFWTTSLRQALGLASAAHLDAQELTQVKGLKRAEDRDRFAAARALLRHALSEAVDHDIDTGSWHYRAGPHGKLKMASGLPPLEFNLSHAGDCVAVGVSRKRPVGIDVEMAGQDGRLEIVTDVLGERERNHLERQPRDRQWDTFLRFWTLKEACAKALGLGVLQDFTELEVELNSATIVAPEKLLGPGQVFDMETQLIIPDQNPVRVSIAAIRNAGEATKFCHRPINTS